MHDANNHSSHGATKHRQHQISTIRSRLIRLPEVLDRIPLSRTSIYNRINDGTFPKPLKLGPKSVAWLESEIDGWIADRVESAQTKEVQS